MRFDLIEVKSTSEVKPHHYEDCAVQGWVVENAGIPLRNILLCHIDTQFVYPGNGDYRGLFHYANITREVRKRMPEVPKQVARFKRMLKGAEPEIETGPHSGDPYPCPFLDYCRRDESEFPVRLLPWAGQLAETLRAEGIEDIRDIPAGRLGNPNHERIRHATTSGRPELDAGAADKLRSHRYPRYYLDFETLSLPVPIWEGTRPFEQIPFQWSCHIERADGSLRHEAFLDTTGTAPMRTFAKRLLGTVRRRGPVFVYSASFEKTRLNALADR